MTRRTDDPTKLIASETVKVYIAPNDPSPVNKSPANKWNWISGSDTFDFTLTSYAPNARVFGTPMPNGNMAFADWFGHIPAGNAKMSKFTDGTSNTMVFIERPMVTGDGVTSFVDGSPGWPPLVGRTPPEDDGVGGWGGLVVPEITQYFGLQCNHPEETWDDEYGFPWQQMCRYTLSNGQTVEGHHPPSRRRPPAQQNWLCIYPFSASSGVQALMGDGSVRSVSPSVSILAWSAAVTPAGGEVISLDQ